MKTLSRNKASRLRDLIESQELSFLMEAHSGLSAKVAAQAGFEGIWASGLSISAMLGVRDANEASWTQVLEVVEFMNDASDLPILLDGDTGYGNFNSVRRLVTKLEQRGVAGVCLEDKVFPRPTASWAAALKRSPIWTSTYVEQEKGSAAFTQSVHVCRALLEALHELERSVSCSARSWASRSSEKPQAPRASWVRA